MGLCVLSLFDGVGSGMVALKRTGVQVDTYYASEIDTYATYVAKRNYADIYHLGTVENWRKWDIDFSKIDLILAGSPCQGLSLAQKGEGFKDSKSKLLFTFVDILRYVQQLNANVKFLLENVRMKKENLGIISDLLEVEGVCLDSANFSAQHRERFYWFNWDILDRLPDDNTVIRDVLEQDVHGKYYYPKNTHEMRVTPSNGVCKHVANSTSINGHDLMKRIYSIEGKSPTLNSMNGGNRHPKVLLGGKYRKLTPLECERLQTLPDNYTAKNGVSDYQRYRMLRNGWTVDVIAFILKQMR